MEEGALALWPSNINLRERDVKPAQAALVMSLGGERCVEKAEEPLLGKYYEDERKRTIR